MRRYYVTQTNHNGAEADGTDGNGAGVCASGYHFASLWEILDPSNLKYDTDLGLTVDDSGQGPPSYSVHWGWVRTGYYSSTSSTAGYGNCNVWTSSNNSHSGTCVCLPGDWQAGQGIHVWEVTWAPCGFSFYVWCVED
jgi:hypothetical protein